MHFKQLTILAGIAGLCATAATAETTVSYITPSADITTGPGQTLIGVAEGLEAMEGDFKFFSAVPPAHNDPGRVRPDPFGPGRAGAGLPDGDPGPRAWTTYMTV